MKSNWIKACLIVLGIYALTGIIFFFIMVMPEVILGLILVVFTALSYFAVKNLLDGDNPPVTYVDQSIKR